MPTIELTTTIVAPIQVVFDLSRNVDAHLASTKGTGEQAVGGVTSGLLELGDEVTWRAKHLGVWQELTSKITKFDPPHFFQDTMQRGAFQRLEHDHYFTETPDGTCLMRDVMVIEAPFGLLGRVAERLFLTEYMRGFLDRRNLALKQLAESGEFLPSR